MYVFNVSGTFYFSDVAPKDWTDPQNDGLWQDLNKTLFDPCPSSWRVPKAKDTSAENPWGALTKDNGPWQGTTPTTTGRLFDITVIHSQPVWYPTSGRRSPNGYFSVYSTHGQYWTTSVTGTIGNIFNSSLDTVTLDITNHHRTYAFSLRCIRE